MIMAALDFVVVGNISYDYNYFPNRDNEELKEVMNYGGATIYSGIPASLFTKVGISAKVGEDYDLSVLDKYNLDLTGVKHVPGKTTMFKQVFTSDDGQLRDFSEFVNENTVLRPEDIPKEYLDAKYIHICTNYPDAQYELVKYLKENSNAVLSIDTLEDYYYDETKYDIIKASFDLVDIAFIDKEFEKLFDCAAKIKIIKLGKEGCKYISPEKTFTVNAPHCDFVVDKTGAGDCVTGVFCALKSIGKSDEEALQTAVNVATESIKDYGMLHLVDKN
jgi:sugar/nucleoside kinase (ribokinase family)